VKLQVTGLLCSLHVDNEYRYLHLAVWDAIEEVKVCNVMSIEFSPGSMGCQ